MLTSNDLDAGIVTSSDHISELTTITTLGSQGVRDGLIVSVPLR